MEEIVGDIADEYERPPAEELKRLDDHTLEVDARMHITELNRALSLTLPEDGDYQTVGGFVITTLGGIPAKVIRMREAPTELSWPDPVEPSGEDELPPRYR